MLSPKKNLQLVLLFSLAFSSSLAWSVERENVRNLDISSINETPRAARLQSSQPALLRQALGLSDTNTFVVKSTRSDRKGNTHTRYSQMYRGVPVWGEQITTHENSQGNIKATGFILKGLDQSHLATVADLQPTISAEEALTIVKESKGHDQASWKTRDDHSELFVFLPKNSSPILAFAVNYFAEPNSEVTPPLRDVVKGEPTRPFFIIDAETGKILEEWEGLNHVEIGSGPGGNVKTGQYEYGTDHGFLDVRQDGTTCTMENENVKTVNLNHGTSGSTAYSYECPRNTVKEINGGYSPLNDAHYFGNVVFNMYDEWLGVAPLTFQLVMRVHYSTNYDNAFWDGSAMTFGDGANSFYPLVDINVSAHEVSHGFTEQNSGLIYANQSGGINEAFSDIAGEAAEQYWRGSVDWFVGGDIDKSRDGLRYFENPTLDGRSIGHADDYYNGMDVHFSSGVYNRAFFLIANTPGWTIQNAFEIFAYANMNYWGPNETYNSAACGVLESAHDLGYNSLDVDDAFQTVGVNCGYLPFIDADGDGMDDNWELSFGLNPEDPSDATGDLDGDTLNNLQEYNLGTSPISVDSDNDSIPDNVEVNTHGTNPADADSDSDLMDDAYELLYGFDPLDSADGALDFDNDGFSNADEYEFGTDPTDASSKPAMQIISFENGSVPETWSVPDAAQAGWEVDTSTAQHGSHSLRASAIANSQRAQIEFTESFAAGSFSFWASTSTESCCDRLYVYVDDVRVISRSGLLDWELHEVDLTEGEHTIRFEYYKDGSVARGDDTVWIDNIRFIYPDQDGDGMTDSWELFYGLDSNDPSDALLDNDGDGLTNLEEFEFDTSPIESDSDGDGLNDGEEVNVRGTDPTSSDTDEDGLNDYVELFDYGTDPLIADTDSDGMPDGWEVSYSLNPLLQSDRLDADGDGWTNFQEYQKGTDPTDNTSFPSGRAAGTGIIGHYDIMSSRGLDEYVPQLEAAGYEAEAISSLDSADFSRYDLLFFLQGENGSYSTTYTDNLNRIFEYIENGGVVVFHDRYVTNAAEVLPGSPGSFVRSTFDDLSIGDSGLDDFYNGPAGTIDNSAMDHGSSSTHGYVLLDTIPTGSIVFMTQPNSGNPVTYSYPYGNGHMVYSAIPLDCYIVNSRCGFEEVFSDVYPTNLLYYIRNHLTLPDDADGDGMPDEWETANGLDLNDPSDALLDGDEDGLVNLQEYLNNTDPANPDSDGDGLTDGDEFLTHRTDPANADTDGDGVSDSVDAFPLNEAASVDGDGDSLPDAWNDGCDITCQQESELVLDNSLNDYDNDGVIDSLDPDNERDNLQPSLIIPDNIVMVATGDETTVELGIAVAIDFVDGPLPVTANRNNVFRPGRNYVEWSATDAAGNTVRAQQIVDIIPLVSFEAEVQTVEEGNLLSVTVNLNGDAVEYPVVIPFVISDDSTANYPEDHNSVAGTFVIETDAVPANSAVIQLATYEQGDLAGNQEETIIIELVEDNGESQISNAALAESLTHTVTIVALNEAPKVELVASQGNSNSREITAEAGLVTISADVTDLDEADLHTFEWIVNGSRLDVAVDNSEIQLDPNSLRDGENNITLIVTDNGTPALSTEQTIVLTVRSSEASTSANSEGGGGSGGGGGSMSWMLVLALFIVAQGRQKYLRKF